ncbi:MAG TPA: HEAT repeat domain-containing protein [Pyrinomonadaceae bacterium]|nr:HEAT repeat domain-containing protein [Pyrinomonadaceae bacterium]
MATGDNSNNNHARRAAAAAAAAPPAPQAARRRSPWPLAVVAALFIILPFLSWYGTTFWRSLDDEEIEKYLNDRDKPRHVQHALEQIDKRIVSGDAGVKKWYPQVIRVAENPMPDLRMAAAWTMGDDNKSVEFHDALKRLLADEEPAVRRMAALSLSRFNDESGRAELLAMLRPFAVRVPFAGTVNTVLPVGSQVSRGAMVSRVRDEKGALQEVRAPVAGKIERVTATDGKLLAAGAELVVLSPDGKNVWEALRALYLVGGAEELQDVERYARGEVAGMSEEIKKQAALTAEAIKSRVARK